jgi:hypothetical protein
MLFYFAENILLVKCKQKAFPLQAYGAQSVVGD